MRRRLALLAILVLAPVAAGAYPREIREEHRPVRECLRFAFDVEDSTLAPGGSVSFTETLHNCGTHAVGTRFSNTCMQPQPWIDLDGERVYVFQGAAQTTYYCGQALSWWTLPAGSTWTERGTWNGTVARFSFHPGTGLSEAYEPVPPGRYVVHAEVVVGTRHLEAMRAVEVLPR